MSGTERLATWSRRLQRFAWGAGPALIYAPLGILRNKWLASTLSAPGLGVLAQVLSAMNWLGQAAGLGLGLPVTRLVGAARAAGDGARERAVMRTALRLALGTSGLVAVLVLIAAPILARALLGSATYAPLFRIASIGIVGLAAAGTLLALAAGRGDIRPPITIAALGALPATALTFLLVPRWGLAGAMIAAAVLYPAGCLAALAVHRRRYRTAFVGGTAVSPGEPAWAMARVGAAGLALGLLDQGVLLVLRAHYVRTYGAAANGFLQAALALSQLTGSLFYTYLASYAFGTLSAAVAAAGPGRGAAAAGAYTRRQGPAIFALAALLFGIGMMISTPLLRILFSHRFDPARPLMAWALLGEYGRVGMQVLLLGALPVGGLRLYAPIAIAFPVALAVSYAAFTATGSGTLSLPRAYAAAGVIAAIAAALIMSRRGVTLGAREVGVLAGGALLLAAIASQVLR
jgi:O-antigen/teichoic acid export membrane protein